MRYFLTRHYIPTRHGESLTWFETDDELRILRNVTRMPEGDRLRTDYRHGYAFRLELTPAVEECSRDDFGAEWDQAVPGRAEGAV